MPELSAWPPFLLASLALIVVPGPAVAFVVAQSLERGARFGVVSTAGLAAGGLLHVAAAVLGLSALVAQSATAYAALKYLGSGYMFYLGIVKLLDSQARAGAAEAPKRGTTLAGAFRQGVVVQILNPKVALFFLSFLPLFVRPDAAQPAMQLAAFGLTFVVLAFLSDAAYALLAGKLGRRFRKSAKEGAGFRLVTAFTYIALGAFALLWSARKD